MILYNKLKHQSLLHFLITLYVCLKLQDVLHLLLYIKKPPLSSWAYQIQVSHWGIWQLLALSQRDIQVENMYYSAWEKEISSEATEDHLHWDSLLPTACTMLYWHGKMPMIKRKRNLTSSEILINVFNIIQLTWDSAQTHCQLWTSGKEHLLLRKLVTSCRQTSHIPHCRVSNSNADEIWRFGFNYIQPRGSTQNCTVPNYTKQSKEYLRKSWQTNYRDQDK